MSTTNAGGQMAGYLWQPIEACRRALGASHDSVVKIEVEDDLSIATMDGKILSCEQLKHSENDHVISEVSPIWWQSIDAWIREPPPEMSKLHLVTTSSLKHDSLLASCYQPTEESPWQRILTKMDQLAKLAPNKKFLQKGVYRRWDNLKDKREFLKRIVIASSQGSLKESNNLLEEALMDRSVSPIIVSRVRESIVGAFMARLTGSLDSGGFEVTVKDMNADLLEANTRHAEPGKYEFFELEYSSDDIRAFQEEYHLHLIPQLAAINRNQQQTITRAMENWFRARIHRQKFMDGTPHEIKDLKSQDDDLKGYCETVHEEYLPVGDAEHSRQVGRTVFSDCMKYQPKLGRSDTPLYFTQGSYHELSNGLHLRWNPTFASEDV